MKVTLQAALLLADLESNGLTVRTDTAGRLLITPTAKLNPGQREGVARWKADLLALVTEREALDVAVLARPPPLARVGWVIDSGQQEAAERIKAGLRYRQRSSAGAGDRVGDGDR